MNKNVIEQLYPQFLSTATFRYLPHYICYKLFGSRPVKLDIDICRSFDVEGITRSPCSTVRFYVPPSTYAGTFSEDAVRKVFERYDYAERPEIEKYYEAKYNIKIMCFTSITHKKTAVISFDRSDFMKNLAENYNILQLFPMYIPWEFPDNKVQISKENADWIQALIKEEVSANLTGTLNRYIKEILISKQFENDINSLLLAQFTKSISESKISNYERNIQDEKNAIQEHISEIVILKNKIHENELKLTGLKYGAESEEAGIEKMIDFIKSAPNIQLKAVDLASKSIHILVTQYLSNWKEETIETLICNHRSYLYPVSRLADKMERFWREVFINETVRIKMRAHYIIYPVQEVVSVDAHYHDDGEDSKYVPNPHLKYFQCLGTMKESFNMAFLNHDYLRVAMLCTVSAGSLNTNESPTTSNFAEDIVNGSHVVEFNGEEIKALNFIENIDKYYGEEEIA